MTDRNQTTVASGKEVTTLGGGCFWCLEAVFDQVEGVESVESGYMGGDVPDPTYEAVCTGRTGHAEVIQVLFDPHVIPYRQLLEVFFAMHDPTTLNRQGHDVGTQYRSAIFYHSDDQKKIAEDVIATLTHNQVFNQPIVTQVVPAGPFYKAEAYHQQFVARNPSQPYCVYVAGPKLAKLRQAFTPYLKRASS